MGDELAAAAGASMQCIGEGKAHRPYEFGVKRTTHQARPQNLQRACTGGASTRSAGTAVVARTFPSRPRCRAFYAECRG
jgi:hypothetical protein